MCFFILLAVIVGMILDDRNTKLKYEIYNLRCELSRAKVETARLRSEVDGLKVVRSTKVKD